MDVVETIEQDEFKKHDWRLLSRLLPYLKKHLFLSTVSFFFMMIMDLSGVVHPYLIKIGIDRYITHHDVRGLEHIAFILLLVLSAGFVFQVLFSYAIQYLGQKLLFDLRMDLFGHMIDLSNDYFDKTPVGNTLTNITNDVESIREFISEGVVSIAGESLKVVFILVAMILVNVRLALLTFVMLPFFIVITIFFRKSLRTGYRGVRKSNAQINTILQESLTGIREIIQFNFKGKSKDHFDAVNTSFLESFLKVVYAYALYFPVIEVAANIAMAIIFLYAHKAMGISIHVGEIFAFYTYINLFFRPLRELAEQFNTFQSAMAAAERTFRLLDQPVTIHPPSVPHVIDPRFKGKITFNHVHFAYKPDNPVLKDISFEIQPGEKVALVGYTGSGKTTIIKLINRFYDIQSGEILIDDIPIQQYDLHQLRSRLATVPQDPFLFTGTITENITMYDPTIPQAQVAEAARQVYADQFIDKLPERYEENVLEEGKRLSVGQKQLISFARGVVRKPTVLILDEATSNIDSHTEKLIEAAIENALKGRTAIIIAHRLSTIQKADRILVLNKGRLVEQGTHQELLKQQGIYSKLYQTQAFSLN
ncbi:MAG: ABC transporter ATP-binding protein [Candidatus Omnitrophota bacterium]